MIQTVGSFANFKVSILPFFFLPSENIDRHVEAATFPLSLQVVRNLCFIQTEDKAHHIW